MTIQDPSKAPEDHLTAAGEGLSLDDETPLTEQPLWRIRLRLTRRRWAENWRLFKANRIGVVGLVIIVVFGIMAVLHPILMATVWPSSIYHPVAGYHAPQVELEVVEEVTDPRAQIDLQRARLRGHPRAEVGDIVMDRLQPAPPSRQHLLGTDPLGRDVLSQLMYGTRAAFALGAVAALVTVVVATMIGAVAAYLGRWIDAVLMRIADLFLLLPIIPVLVFVAGLWTINLWSLGLLIGLAAGLGPTAIVLKSQALTVKVKPFIDAARIAGGSHLHIIFRHIVPNVVPLAFLYMMFTVTAAIGLEATLSFFGLLDIPMSWGIMIHTAQTTGYLLRGTDFWWLLLPAGGAVSVLAAAFYLVGRGFDEVINPRLRQR